MKIKFLILLMFGLLIFCFISCVSYTKLNADDFIITQSNDEKLNCKEYYCFGNKNYETTLSMEYIFNSWEEDGIIMTNDTIFKEIRKEDTIHYNKEWFSPQIKIWNFSDPSISIKINFLNLVVYRFSKTTIQIHGICLKNELNKELSKKELKEIELVIENKLIDKFMNE